MKILIISRTPWNDSNSFGNTFSNLFGGMPDIEVYNICCQKGSTKNDVVIRTLQMSERSILRSLRGGNIVISQNNFSSQDESKIGGIAIAPKHKTTSLLLVRDFVWWLGRYKYQKAILSFIDGVKPDLIYMPIYSSLYMCDIDRFIINYTKVPVIGHITDDVYSYPPNCNSFSLTYQYRNLLRKKIRALIDKVSYIEVFAQNMKNEYEKIFNKPCYIIGKGIELDMVSKPQYHCNIDGIIHFVYTGGIGGERYGVLVALGKALEGQTIQKCYLDIYTTTLLTKEMKEEIDSISSIKYHGAISGTKVKEIQKRGDYLIHVEGFSAQSVFSTKMSFSTKIIDYLSTGNLMIAIGPNEINSIQILKEKTIAFVIDNVDKIQSSINYLLNGNVDTKRIQENAYRYLLTERTKKVFQSSMVERFKALLSN